MLRRITIILLFSFLIITVNSLTAVADRPSASTNQNYPSNGDLVYRDLWPSIGHTGIFWKIAPINSERYIIQASGRGYTVDSVRWRDNDVNTANFMADGQTDANDYWGSYSLNDVDKTKRHAITYEAKSHISVEEYPTTLDFLSDAYKNPKNNPYYHNSTYPNGSFRCDGFTEYIYETAFGDSWRPRSNTGIFPNDGWNMSPEGQMEWANNETVSKDGHNTPYHGGGKDGYEETTAPSIQISSGPSGWVKNALVGFGVTGSDNFTATEDLYFRFQFVAIQPNPNGNTTIPWTNWGNANTQVGILSEGGWRFEAQSRDLVGNPSQSTSWQTFGIDRTSPANPTTCNAWDTSSKTNGISNNVPQNITANPYFEWSGASDGLSGVAGYSVYFGTSSSGEPGTTQEQTGASYDAGADPGTAGTYYLRVRTFDAAGNYSEPVKLFTVLYNSSGPVNHDPNTPQKPTGPTVGYVNSSYTFTSSATDSDNDNVRLKFYWGSDSEHPNQTWAPGSGYAASGTVLTASHAFSSTGTYQVKVMAEDEHGAISDWSEVLAISIQEAPVPKPEIDISGKGVSITSGDTTPSAADDTNFGSTTVYGTPVTHIFAIKNTGAANLSLNGVPTIEFTGANSADFAIASMPSLTVAPGGSTTFGITFVATGIGLRTATIKIVNNDDDENPYTFTVQGTGTAPDINIKGNGQDIVNGDTTPGAGDNTDFGTAVMDKDSPTRTFMIQNLGNVNLSLTGSPAVEIAGADAGDFSVTHQPYMAILAPGNSTTFNVAFVPKTVGTRSATIRVYSSDTNENPYTFAIQGTGTDFIFEPGPDPASRTINQGESTNYSIALKSVGGYNSPVSLSVSRISPEPWPNSAALTCSFSPSQMTPQDPAVATLNITTSQKLMPNITYSICIKAADGSKTKETMVKLTVMPSGNPYTTDELIEQGKWLLFSGAKDIYAADAKFSEALNMGSGNQKANFWRAITVASSNPQLKTMLINLGIIGDGEDSDPTDDILLFDKQGEFSYSYSSVSDIIVDNSDPGYSETGSGWETVGYGRRDSCRVHEAGTGSNVATWTITVPISGYYYVTAWWPRSTNFATTAKFTIYYDGGAVTKTRDQKANHDEWIFLERCKFSAGTPVKIELSDDASGGQVAADAVKLEFEGDVVDDAEAVFTDGNTGWQTMTETPGFNSGHKEISSGYGGTCVWAYNVPQAGPYVVYVRFRASGENAADATYTIAQAGSAPTTILVNQQRSNWHWVSLGLFDLRANTDVTVTLAQNASGNVIADAVRFLPTRAFSNLTEAQATFTGTLAEIDQALAYLGNLTNTFQDTVGPPYQDFDTELDYGDVLMFKAGFNLIKSNLNVSAAYDMDNVDLNELGSTYEDLLSVNYVLNKYLNFGKLNADGATRLSTAKTALIASIDGYLAGYDFIKAETDSQDDDFITFNSPDLQEGQSFVNDKLREALRNLRGELPSFIMADTDIGKLDPDSNFSEMALKLMVNLAAFFDNPTSPRGILPNFDSSSIIQRNSWPDATLGGVLPDMTKAELDGLLGLGSDLYQAETHWDGGNACVNLNWKKDGYVDFVSYKIFRSTTDNVNESSQEIFSSSDVNSTSFTDTTVSADQNIYYYRLYTYYSDGNKITSVVKRVIPRLYVDISSASAYEDGTKVHPYKLLRDGIGAAQPGTKVCVAKGTYSESARTVRLWNKTGLVLEGGYEPENWTRNITANETVIDSAGYSDWAAIGVSNTEGVVIDGFTIINAVGEEWAQGIDIWQARDIIVRNCKIANCNRGISVTNGSSALIMNNLICNNRTQGINCYASNPISIMNNTIVGNGGGGIQCSNRSVIAITDNIIAGNNTGPGDEFGIWNDASSVLSLSCNDVVGHPAGNYGNCSPGTGDISSDPLFVAGPSGDYYLSQTAAGQATDSPCVDSGSDTAENLGFGQDYATRTDGAKDLGTVDMGYHYYKRHVNSPPELNPIGEKSIKELQTLEFTVSATDPDEGDIITYSATGLPGGASLDSNTGNFTWTPSHGQIGVHTVTFTASDEGGLSDEEAVIIKVLPEFLGITGLSVVEAYPTSTVHIYGGGFCAKDGNSKVILTDTDNAETEAVVNYWRDNHIKFTVPTLPAGQYNVKVVTTLGETNTLPFTVKSPILIRLNTAEDFTDADVYITGDGLGDQDYNSRVILIDSNGAETNAEINYWRNNIIRFTVPGLTAGQYNIKVITTLGATNTLPFRVKPPTIRSISPASSSSNRSVYILGGGFGTQNADTKIILIDSNSVETLAVITLWKDTRIRFIVPVLPAGKYGIKVVTTLGETNSKSFTVK